MVEISRAIAVALMCLPLGLARGDQARAEGVPRAPADIFELNQALSPGVNLGNVLEANPPESWGLSLDHSDFPVMARAGFKSLRLPVRWSAKAMEKKPFTIDEAFMAKVEGAVRAALSAGLYVVLDMHHYDEIFGDPDGHWERFLAMWDQISSRFKDYPRALLFEPLNEPHDALTGEIWNMMYKDALKTIRKTNPDRAVVIDAADYGGAWGLARLSNVKKDRNLIFSFHHYVPFEFTHQGAEWVGSQSQAWLGRSWSGSESDLNDVRAPFEEAAKFARRNKVPMYLGEFGAYSKADADSRVLWTRAVVNLAREYGFSTAYWEFKAGGFGLYNSQTGKWNEGLKKALLYP